MDCEVAIYYNYLKINYNYKPVKKYLFMWEPISVQPILYDKSYHKHFDKIFTFADDLVDNKKYFKINYAYLIPNCIPKDLSKKEHFCVLIAGNKTSRNKLELYSQRIKTIRWFEKNHIESFDLYGIGWDKYIPHNYVMSGLYKKSPKWLRSLVDKFFNLPYKSYKGEIKYKYEVLVKYKFSICYENIRDINGYITEKIFHCFFAGCVPVYWGASNIEKYIPSNCFIDRRKFQNHESLYDYLINMSEREYITYLDNIENYLNSTKVSPFSADVFVQDVIKKILHEK